MGYFTPATLINRKMLMIGFPHMSYAGRHGVCSDESMFEYLNVVSKMFDSEAEGYEFYNKYALEKGFSVRKSYVEWDGSNKYII